MSMREEGHRRAPRTAPIVDAHGHVKWCSYNAERLVANMDEHGISLMWLLTWEVDPSEVEPAYDEVFWPGRFGMPLEDVLEAVERYPDRFVPFLAPDPRKPHALRRFQGAIKNHGIRGCGELKCRVMLDDPAALELFHCCAEAGLPVVFHMDVPLPRRQLGRDPGYWYCCDWENLARALELCPRTVFIGHAPGFWREISGDADTVTDAYPSGAVTPGGRLWAGMDRHPNLYADLSAGSAFTALSRDPAKGREFLLRYADRCLFGRDYFDDRLHRFIRSCRLPTPVYRQIMSGNALRLVPVPGLSANA